ncbi:MAG: NAD(P)H-dependent oxidoreductase [Gammaproteobacteria bacterium]
MTVTVGVIVGSLRKGAYTRLLASSLAELKPASWTLLDIGIGDLPLYNQDLETENPPAAWTEFRSKAGGASALLIITPEYNRGMPGGLKNAFDVGSRPWGKSIWSGKPTAVMSMSPGPLGGMAAHQQVRHTLSVLNSPTLPGPEVYLHSVASLFDDAGKLTNADTRKIVTGFLAAFDTWIQRFGK